MNLFELISLMVVDFVFIFILVVVVASLIDSKTKEKKKKKLKAQKENEVKSANQKPNWIFHNENPSKRSTTDCQIRAIAKLLAMDWSIVYKELYDLGLETFVVYNHESNLQHYLDMHGYKKFPISSTLIANLPHLETTRIILQTNNHMMFYDGKNIYDTFDSTELNVIAYYIEA